MIEFAAGVEEHSESENVVKKLEGVGHEVKMKIETDDQGSSLHDEVNF